jgi:hypothetical protein
MKNQIFMRQAAVSLLFITCLLTLTDSTLGPGDRKKKPIKPAKPSVDPIEPFNPAAQTATENFNQPPDDTTSSDTATIQSGVNIPPSRQLVRESVSKTEILKNYNKYCKSCATRKEFNGNILGYVTPWHSTGYDVAKAFGHKINMVSPVWLQIKRMGRRKYELTGVQDVDAGWMSAVRKNSNNTSKILPRILFEKFKMEDLNALFHDEQEIEALSKMLVSKSAEYRFDGYVLEIYMQLSGQGKTNINHLVSDIADALHAHNRMLIVVIPPPVANIQPQGRKPKPMFDSDDFELMKDKVDAFSLMTYDYASHNQLMGLVIYFYYLCVQAC